VASSCSTWSAVVNVADVRRIVFYSGAANGDLHVSRGLVRYVADRLPEVSFSYLHQRDPKILWDIPRVFWESDVIPFHAQQTGAVLSGSTLYINTWYGAENDRFVLPHCKPGKYTCCFDSLYDAFEEALTPHFGDILAEVHPSKLFPTIDYREFEIERARAFADAETRPMVFVANGCPGSGQSENFDLSGFTRDVASRHKDVLFLLTAKDGEAPTDNVLFTSDIIGKSTGPTSAQDRFAGVPDINETAYLSTRSKAIVGRASGPFTFAMTQENLFRPVEWACFHNGAYDFGEPFWLGKRFGHVIRYASPVPEYLSYDRATVIDVLERIVEAVR